MDPITSTDVAPRQAATYDRILLERGKTANVHRKDAQKRRKPKGEGTQVSFRRFAQLSVATKPLTEGVTPDGSSISVSDITAILKQYGDFVPFTDVVDLINLDPVLAETISLQGDQMGETIDVLSRDVMVAGTNVFYANGTTRAGLNTAPTEALFRKIVTFLKTQKAKQFTSIIKGGVGIGTVPVSSAYRGIVHPHTTETFKTLGTAYTKVKDYPNPAAAFEYEVGAIDECRFKESTNGKIFIDSGLAVGGDAMRSTGAANNDVYVTLVYGRNSYGVIEFAPGDIKSIVKALGSGGTQDPLNQRSTSGWKLWDCTAILNEFWIARLEHTNKENP